MKSDVETLSPTRVKLTIEVPFEELQPSFTVAFARIAKQINIPGFRKGKVPTRIIEQRVGREAVLEEAVNEAIPKAYEEAIRANDVVPIGRPEIDVPSLEDGQSLTFTAEVDVRPTFDLPDLSTLRVEVAEATPSDDDVATQVDALRTRFATLKDVDRAAADGDVLLVDISGETDLGDAVEDLTGTALSYELGTDGMLPGFDDAVRGAAKGDTRTFEFAPENGDWAGVTLLVTVSVAAVRERELPPLDDDFAQLASEFDTVAELQADVRTRLVRMKRFEQADEARSKMHEALMESIDIPIPEGVVAAEVADHFNDGHEGSEEHRAEVEAEARAGLKSRFILDKIAETQSISVGESEFSSWVVQQAPRYGMTPDALAKALVEANQISGVIQEIRRAKAIEAVVQLATVVDTAGNPVDVTLADLMIADAREMAAADEDAADLVEE